MSLGKSKGLFRRVKKRGNIPKLPPRRIVEVGLEKSVRDCYRLMVGKLYRLLKAKLINLIRSTDMATETSLAALGVGPSAISNAATAVGMGVQALFVNPLTVGAIGGFIVGIGVYALLNRLRAKPKDETSGEEFATEQGAPAGG
jgi:hypothetical protein